MRSSTAPVVSFIIAAMLCATVLFAQSFRPNPGPGGGGGDSTWTTVLKTSDTTRTGTDTPTADPALATPALVGAHVVRGVVHFTTDLDADFQFDMSAGGISRLSALVYDTEGGVTPFQVFDGATITTTTTGVIHFECRMTGGGTYAFAWAQGTSDVANTRVLAGSYIEYAAVQ